MTRRGSEFDAEFEGIRTEWPKLQNKTKQKLQALRQDYRTSNSSDFDQLANEHERLSSRASNVNANLNRQVESSANRVDRIEKYGRRAVAAFALVCCGIGAGIGSRFPAWWPIAVVIGALIGFFGFGGAALLLYFILKWRAVRRRGEWHDVMQRNPEGIALSSVIGKKRREINEIGNIRRGIQPDNWTNEVRVLEERIATY